MDSQTLRSIVASNLIRLTGERGISLSRLAELAGVAHATVVNASKARQSLTLDTVAKLAEALDVEPLFLLTPFTRKR